MAEINRTPEEIKKRLQRCKNNTYCDDCPSEYHCQIEADALAYIQQLESRLAQVERERDALMHDLANSAPCFACYHFI